MKNYTLSLIALIVTIQTVAMAQPDSLWSRTYSWPEFERGNAIVPLDDGGSIVSGSISLFDEDESRSFLIRIDASGDSLWSILFPTTFTSAYSHLLRTEEGVVMQYWSLDDPRAFSAICLYGISLDGEIVWEKRIESNEERWRSDVSLIKGDDDRIWSVHNIGNMGSRNTVTELIELSPAGDSLQSFILNLPENGTARSAIRLHDGGILLLGGIALYNDDTLTSWDPLAAKVDREGQLMWSYIPEEEIVTGFRKAVECNDGGFQIFSQHQYKPHIVRLSNEGELLTFTEFTQYQYYNGYSILEMPDGNILIGGFAPFSFQDNFNAAWLLEVNPMGEVLWERIYPEGLAIYSMSRASDNRLIVTGSSGNNRWETHSDLWVMGMSIGEQGVNSSPIIQPYLLSIVAYPNPFNSTTLVTFSTPFNGIANITLTDLSGRAVRSWVENVPRAGEFRLTLNGEGLTAGTYWLKAEQNGTVAGTRLVLVK